MFAHDCHAADDVRRALEQRIAHARIGGVGGISIGGQVIHCDTYPLIRFVLNRNQQAAGPRHVGNNRDPTCEYLERLLMEMESEGKMSPTSEPSTPFRLVNNCPGQEGERRIAPYTHMLSVLDKMAHARATRLVR
jgi:hypothetical protein